MEEGRGEGGKVALLLSLSQHSEESATLRRVKHLKELSIDNKRMYCGLHGYSLVIGEDLHTNPNPTPTSTTTPTSTPTPTPYPYSNPYPDPNQARTSTAHVPQTGTRSSSSRSMPTSTSGCCGCLQP